MAHGAGCVFKDVMVNQNERTRGTDAQWPRMPTSLHLLGCGVGVVVGRGSQWEGSTAPRQQESSEEQGQGVGLTVPVAGAGRFSHDYDKRC